MKQIFKICLVILFLLPISAKASNYDELSPMAGFKAQELNKFALDWVDFVNWAYKKGEYFNDNSFDDLTMSTYKYSDNVIKWLEDKHWTVDRFFFVEKRVRTALQAIMLEKKIVEKNQTIIQNMRVLEENDVIPNEQKQAILQKMKERMKKNEKIMNSYSITEEEINLVKPLEKELWKIFEYNE
jgi:hypothetical protein